MPRIDIKKGTYVDVMPDGIKLVSNDQMIKLKEADILPIFDAILLLYEQALKNRLKGEQSDG